MLIDKTYLINNGWFQEDSEHYTKEYNGNSEILIYAPRVKYFSIYFLVKFSSIFGSNYLKIICVIK